MARVTKLTVAKKTVLLNLPNLNSLLYCRAQRPEATAPAPKHQLLK